MRSAVFPFSLCFFLVIVTLGCAQERDSSVYVTRTGSKYHRAACQYLKSSSIKISKTDAVENGYTPCSVCKPGKNASESPSRIETPTPAATTPSAATKQCSGTTQKGARCKRMTTNANGRCYQH